MTNDLLTDPHVENADTFVNSPRIAKPQLPASTVELKSSTTVPGTSDSSTRQPPSVRLPLILASVVMLPLLLMVFLTADDTGSEAPVSMSASTATSPASHGQISTSESKSSRQSLTADSAETGAAGMTVRDFTRHISGQSWDASELYGRYGQPIRVFKPHTYFIYLWFQCRDGIAEVECEATGFEMYNAISHVSVRRK